MKRFISLLLLFCPLVLFSQRRESIAETENLTKGVLPNGISYFLVRNSDIKGYADFSLIQQGMAGKSAIKEILSEAPNFKVAPYKFLASKGVGFGSDGYVTESGEDAIVRLRNVPVYDTAASDSTLLLMFDLIETSPAQQALIICGDIDSPELLKQIKMLSLSIPERTAITEQEPYSWEPRKELEVITKCRKGTDLAEISITYYKPRIPREFLSGTRLHISEMLSGQLGTILCDRVQEAFRKQDIPVSNLHTENIGSNETGSDEQFRLVLDTSAENIEQAITLLSGVLASLDRNGASKEELSYAKGVVSLGLRQAATKEGAVTNEEYSDLCIASYLYGATVTSRKAVRDYFRSRTLDPDTELTVFNKFTSALLSPSDNISLSVITPREKMDSGNIADIFSKAWKAGEEVNESGMPQIPVPSKLKKQKIKSTLTDPVTGGTIWTFANGFKLLYKNVPECEGFSYSLALHGGLPLVPGLEEGESAFANDVLRLFKVGGMSGYDFNKALLANGISFTPEIGMTDFRISGSADVGDITTLMSALSAYAGKRQADEKAFAYYRKCKSLDEEMFRMGEKGVRLRMEDLSSVGDFYSSSICLENLGDNFPWKLERYLETMFSKTDDGSLIIIGNIDRDLLVNTVSRYAGLFGTGRKAAIRTTQEYEIIPGWNTRTYDTATSDVYPEVRGVNILLNSYYPFSIKNAIAFEIACEAILIELNKALADQGLYAQLDREIHLSPSERICVYVSCKNSNPDGLPVSINGQKTDKALKAVRSVLTSLSQTQVSETLLKTSKTNIAFRYASQVSNPAFLMEAAIIRNSLGMNLISGYKPALESVGEPDVRKVLEELDRASKVEFIYK